MAGQTSGGPLQPGHDGVDQLKGSRMLKPDIGKAKNYLDKEEIDTLNRITVM